MWFLIQVRETRQCRLLKTRVIKPGCVGFDDGNIGWDIYRVDQQRIHHDLRERICGVYIGGANLNLGIDMLETHGGEVCWPTREHCRFREYRVAVARRGGGYAPSVSSRGYTL